MPEPEDALDMTETDAPAPTRRAVLIALAALVLSESAPRTARADDGGGGGGGGDSGHDGDSDGGKDKDGGGDKGKGKDKGRERGRSRKGRQKDDDYAKARDALKRGEAKPLGTIYDRVRGRYQGKIVGVKLRSSGGRLVYDVSMLDGRGRLFRVRVDAQTASIIGVVGY